LILAVGLMNCSQAASVTGSVHYRERMALPPNAVFEAVLLDVSRADVRATVLGRVITDDIKGIPIEFVIPYDPDQVDQRMSYSVRATIRVEGQLWFSTDTHYPVLTRSSPDNVELLLKRVSSKSHSFNQQ